MRCSNCGLENQDDASCCIACGWPLLRHDFGESKLNEVEATEIEKNEADTNEVEQNEAEPIKIESNKVESNWAELNPVDYNTNTIKPNEKKSNGVAIVIVLVVIIALLVCACLGIVFVVMQRTSDNRNNVRVLYETDEEDSDKDDDLEEVDEDDKDGHEEVDEDDKDNREEVDEDDREDVDEDNKGDREEVDEDENEDDKDDNRTEADNSGEFMRIGDDRLGYTSIPKSYDTVEYPNMYEGTLAYQSMGGDASIIQLIPIDGEATEISLQLIEMLGKSGNVNIDDKNDNDLIIAENADEKHPLIIMYVIESGEDECVVLSFEFTENTSENEEFAMDIIDSYEKE